jgi:hypothetical protein
MLLSSRHCSLRWALHIAAVKQQIFRLRLLSLDRFAIAPFGGRYTMLIAAKQQSYRRYSMPEASMRSITLPPSGAIPIRDGFIAKRSSEIVIIL